MSAPPSGGGAPIENRRQLIEYFAAGNKPRAAWRMGTEHEKFGFHKATLKPLAYDGPDGIRALLAGEKRDLLDIELDPQFPQQPYVYALYTRDAPIGGTSPTWGTAGHSGDPCPTPPGNRRRWRWDRKSRDTRRKTRLREE